MTQTKGFSLIELLLSLALIAGTSLTLLAQQWQLSHAFNQSLTKLAALIELDNQREIFP